MDNDGSFFLGVAVGTVLMAAICFGFSRFPGSMTNQARVAISTCEETLSRNQQCVITARPEETQ